MPIRLQLRWTAILIAASALACHDNTLGPAVQPQVTLTLHVLSLPPGSGALSAPYIKLAGDSILAWTTESISGCYDYTARGEASIGLLVLSIVESEANRVCIPESTLESAIVVAHDMPPGIRRVSLVERIVHLNGSSYETVVAHADINVP